MLDHRTLIPHCVLLLLLISVPSVLQAAPLAITRVKDLSFGSFIGGGGYSGTVTIDPSGARSASGGIRLLGGDTFSPAQFTISGNPGTRYNLTVPASVDLSSGSAYISMSQLTVSVPITGVLPAGGSTTLFVGATLSVGTSQLNGVYSGSFEISVNRN